MTVGQKGYSGSFICGNKGHSFQQCPQRGGRSGSRSSASGPTFYLHSHGGGTCVVENVMEVPQQNVMDKGEDEKVWMRTSYGAIMSQISPTKSIMNQNTYETLVRDTRFTLYLPYALPTFPAHASTHVTLYSVLALRVPLCISLPTFPAHASMHFTFSTCPTHASLQRRVARKHVHDTQPESQHESVSFFQLCISLSTLCVPLCISLSTFLAHASMHFTLCLPSACFCAFRCLLSLHMSLCIALCALLAHASMHFTVYFPCDSSTTS